MNLRNTILAMLTAAFAMLAAPAAFAQQPWVMGADPTGDACLDIINRYWRDVEVDRVTTHDLFLEKGAEAIDDFRGDSRIMRWYWEPIKFYTGRPLDRKAGQFFAFPRESGPAVCRAIVRDITADVCGGCSEPKWWKRNTYLHELGHHISMDYIRIKGGRRDPAVREKHADFWAGAIAYRISKNEPGWTADDLYQGEKEVWRHVRGSRVEYDERAAFELGWAQAEYGDTWLARYGEWDAARQPWLWEPSTIEYFSAEEDDGWVKWECAHTHVGRHIDTLTRRK